MPADVFSSFTSSVGFRDEIVKVKNERGHIHTDTSLEQEVKLDCVLSLFVVLSKAISLTGWYL